MRSIRVQHWRCARCVADCPDVLRGVFENPRERIAGSIRLRNGERQSGKNFSRCRDAFEWLHLETGELPKNRDRFFTAKKVDAEYFHEGRPRNERIHRQEDGDTLGTLAAPGIGSVPITALEQVEESRKTCEQLSNLKLVKWANETEVTAGRDEIIGEVFIKK